jgi:hypothetical protein
MWMHAVPPNEDLRRGRDATFVVYQDGMRLLLGKRSDRGGRYSAPVTLTTGSPGWDVFPLDATAVAVDRVGASRLAC